MDIVEVLCNKGQHIIGFTKDRHLVYQRPGEYGGTVSSYIWDAREHECKICSKGWEATVESLTNHYNDGIHPQEHFHRSCLVGHMAMAQEDLINQTVQDINRPYRIERIPDEYKAAWGTPWFMITVLRRAEDGEKGDQCRNVETPFKIKFGRRKRVFEVALLCSDKSIRLKASDHLKYLVGSSTAQYNESELMVHAWGKDQVVRYVREFGEIIRMLGFPPLGPVTPTLEEELLKRALAAEEKLKQVGQCIK